MANKARAIREDILSRHPQATVYDRRQKGIRMQVAADRWVDVSSVEPLHIAGTDTEIDTDWQPSTLQPYLLQMVQADYHVYFGNGNLLFDSGMPFRVVQPLSGAYIEWQATPTIYYQNQDNQIQVIGDIQSVPALVGADDLYFTGAYGDGIDYRVKLAGAQLEKQIRLLQPPVATTLTGTVDLVYALQFRRSAGLSIWSDGVQWPEGNGAGNALVATDYVEIKTADGSTQLYLVKPWAKSLLGGTDISMRVRRQGASFFMEYRLPYQWILQQPPDAYPVWIDPTTNPQVGASGEEVTQNTGTTVASGTNRRLNSTTPWYGVRWSSVAVPNNATTNSCYPQLWGDHPSLNTFDSKAQDFNAADSASAWSEGDTSDISGRTLTGNAVATQITLSESAFTNCTTMPSAADAIWGRAGWSSGQAVACIWAWDDVDGTGAAQISSYADSTSEAAMLYVDYTAASGSTLTVQNATHTHTPTAAGVLSQVHNLAAPAAGTHTHTPTATGALIQQHNLTVADATHTHAATSAGVLEQAYQLTLQDATHTHAATSAGVLVQQHNIAAPDPGTHTHTSTSVVLSQVHNIAAPDPGTHTHTSTNVSLAGEAILTVQDATHTHSATAAGVLVQQHNLITADATHTHAADSILITQQHNLITADATHTHSATNVSLGGEGALVVQNATHGHTSTSVVLLQDHQLIAQDATHTHSATSVSLSGAADLVVADGTHGHTSTSAGILSVEYSLDIADGTHGHTASAVVITQLHQLVVADGTHTHTADNITLDYVPLYTALVDLTLYTRDTALSLDTRDTSLTLDTRDTSLTLRSK